MSSDRRRSSTSGPLEERPTPDADETLPEDFQDLFEFDASTSSGCFSQALAKTDDLIPIIEDRAPITLESDVVEPVFACPTCGQVYREGERFCGVDGSVLLPITSRRAILESGGEGTLLAGRYLIGRLIARSQNAVVFEARQVHLGREVAIKFVNPQRIADGSAGHILRHEAAQTAALFHPRIVQILDFGIDHGELPYLAMERLEGETLSDRLKRGPMTPEQVIELGKQVCQALRYIHHQGVIHRDLTPSNLWLEEVPDESISVKLLDFGQCKLLRSDDRYIRDRLREKVVGTPTYMAPEQSRGELVDRRSDLYSLGCILWEALTGRPLVYGRTTLDVMRQHGERPAVPPSRYARGVDHLLDSVILRALAKDPAARWATGSDMYAALSV